jgi:hypothetical protein
MIRDPGSVRYPGASERVLMPTGKGEPDLTRIRARGAIFALVLVLAAALAGCGGDGGGGEDPGEVLDQTFNNPEEITSGRVDISLEGSAEGGQAGNLTATIEGPFQTDQNDPAAFPQLDLSAEISASATGEGPLDFTGGFVATEDSAFVEYQEQAYEVSESFFKRLKTLSERSVRRAQARREDASIFERLGIEPQNWLTNLSNEGDEDVEGTETIHIHGDADIEQIASDLSTIAQRAPGAAGQALDPAQLEEVETAIKGASVDVYSGKDDRVLRRLSLSLDIEPPAGPGALDVSRVSVDFSLTLSDVNAPQTITAPSGAKPISGLLDDLGLGDLGAPPSGGSGGGGPGQAYLDCIENNPADPGKCVSRL